MFHYIPCVSLALAFFAIAASCQQVLPADPGQLAADAENSSPLEPESKRVLWIIPNYRTSPTLNDFKPLTAGEKFKIGSEDAFDRGTFALAALFAGEAQLTNANRSFGQGVAC
jgi:hypothetical protein